ncbi:LuxR C-terminal-related transcriptional regulator [Streptomyces wedmorensis]
MIVQAKLSQWPLTCRESELQTFTAAWANPRCQAVVIQGPAGVGKSRLAERFLAEAARAGFKTGRATASAAASTVPLGAVAHLIPASVDLSDPAKGFAEAASVLTGPRRRKWAIWVDDLHLLDATSAVLLRHLMDARVIRLIGTVRTSEPIGEAVSALTGGEAAFHIDLSELDSKQSEVLLPAVLGGPVGHHALRELHAASGGNVLYLRELVTGALTSGTLANDGEIWELVGDRPVRTPKLSELIEARLAGAGQDTRQVLELLALCELLPLAHAQAVASHDAIAALEETGLVQVITDRRRKTLRLAHPLYGEVLRTELPSLKRRALLMQQAERVQAHGAHRRDDALQVASWRLAATGTADPALLVHAATLARYAHDYERAVTLLRALPEDDHTAASLMLLGDCLFTLFEAEDAEKALSRAHALAQSDQELLDVTLARTMNFSYAAGSVADALSVNDTALKSLSGTEERRMLRINEGSIRALYGPALQAVTLLDEMDADPRQTPHLGIWVLAAMMRSPALALTGRTEDAVSWGEHAFALHSQLPEAVVMHPVGHLVGLTLALTDAGRLDDARRTGHRAWAVVGDARIPMAAIWISYHLGRAELLAGHPETARRWFANCAAEARIAHHNVPALRLALSGISAAAALLGDHDAAQTAEDEAATYTPMGYRAGEDRLGEAWLHVAHGSLAQARTTLARAAQAAEEASHIPSEIVLLTDIARLGGAKDVTERLTELTQLSDGALAPACAHLATALAADDPALLQAASRQLGAVGADLLAAEAAAAASAAWHRSRQAREAAAAAYEAQTYAARCEGARTPLLTTAEAAFALTPREREIALLAATNTTSKDIAASLDLSVRTVDNHLQRAYNKLGVTTRRELATALGIRAPHGQAGPGE